MISSFKWVQLKSRLVTSGVLVLLILLLIWFSSYPGAVERFYSSGLYPVICHCFHPVFNLFPFSSGDILYLLVIACLIYIFVKLAQALIRRRWGNAARLALGTINGILVAYLVFYVFWGLNYYRPEAIERLSLPDTAYTATDLKAVTALLIDSANICRSRLLQSDWKRSNNQIYQQAVAAQAQLSVSFPAFKNYAPKAKSSLLTPIINYLGTSGYYNPFTSESQVNYQMPVFLKPFVTCHELSHQAGFAPEDEANFAGFITATKSKDNFFRYSAYYEGVEEFMFALNLQDSIARKQLKKRISPQVLSDFKAERIYWLKYQGQIERISSVFYDKFLKANNQPQGLKTYNRMVLLIMAYRKKHEL